MWEVSSRYLYQEHFHRLYKINKGFGMIYHDGLRGSHPTLGIDGHRRKLVDRYEVQSLEVEGNEVTCCFTVFR